MLSDLQRGLSGAGFLAIRYLSPPKMLIRRILRIRWFTKILLLLGPAKVGHEQLVLLSFDPCAGVGVRKKQPCR